MATIRKRGNRYHVQIRRRGQSITKTFDRLATAKSWIPKIEGDIERHLYIENSGLERTILLELFERYERQVLPSHKGQQVERYRLGTLKRRLGSIRLIHLTSKEIASYRDIRHKEVSPSSLKRELTILSRVLTIASKDWGISIPQNPVKMISLPKADKARTRRLEAGEKERLLQSANPELHRIITVALETAMRRGEILSVKKSHIDFNKSVLFIPSTKTDTPRSIPLSSAALTSLRGQLRTSQSVSGGVIPLHEAPLFTYSLRGLSGAFLRLCRRLNINNLHFHDLRHEATSRLFEKGLNPVEVATITGHKDTRMLMRYTHLRAEDLVGRLG
jgi:integrase